ncbi:MAG: helix-turn-helix domain-containing protein [Xanthomonadales bacterium]|nr:helix-turn-helix domain-containing protein [Xanthomonadales bacterium]
MRCACPAALADRPLAWVPIPRRTGSPATPALRLLDGTRSRARGRASPRRSSVCCGRRSGDWPGLAAVARALGRSPRSLQRALAAEGEGFRAIRERVRAERARELLGAGGLPVGLVAERLGYRDPGNFARSVRRWTGTLPRALRPKRAARAATSAEPPDAPRAGGARRGPASSPRGATAPRTTRHLSRG